MTCLYLFVGSCQDADAVGSRCLGLIECPHDSARTAVSTVAPPTLLRLLLAIIVGVLALQSLFVDVAAVVTLISGRFEVRYFSLPRSSVLSFALSEANDT
jgi:hypothetical protein